MPDAPSTETFEAPSPEVLKSLDTVLAYQEIDERRHYEETDCPSNHIYLDILRVKEWRKTLSNPPLDPNAHRQD